MPVKFIQQTDAPTYCGCSLNTLKKYVKDGKLPEPFVEHEGNRVKKYWNKQDLDALKKSGVIGAYKGRRGSQAEGRPPVNVVTVAEPDDALSALPAPLNEPTIGELQTVEAGLAVACGIPPTATPQQAEELFRRQIIAMAVKNKAIAKMFEHALSASPSVSLAALKEIWSRLTPALKTINTVKTEDKETARKSAAATRALEIIAERMTKVYGPAKQAAIEGEYRVIEPD